MPSASMRERASRGCSAPAIGRRSDGPPRVGDRTATFRRNVAIANATSSDDRDRDDVVTVAVAGGVGRYPSRSVRRTTSMIDRGRGQEAFPLIVPAAPSPWAPSPRPAANHRRRCRRRFATASLGSESPRMYETARTPRCRGRPGRGETVESPTPQRRRPATSPVRESVLRGVASIFPHLPLSRTVTMNRPRRVRIATFDRAHTGGAIPPTAVGRALLNC